MPVLILACTPRTHTSGVLSALISMAWLHEGCFQGITMEVVSLVGINPKVIGLKVANCKDPYQEHTEVSRSNIP